MDAEEAVAYGIIDKIFHSRKEKESDLQNGKGSIMGKYDETKAIKMFLLRKASGSGSETCRGAKCIHL